jgi:hypothetical protein
MTYLMLNKPRGLVTTRHDPEGRPTVFDCLKDIDTPHLSPVGRLDKASEGCCSLPTTPSSPRRCSIRSRTSPRPITSRSIGSWNRRCWPRWPMAFAMTANC